MKNFRNDAAGSISVVFAIMAVILIGAAGIALDYAYWRVVQTKLQETADAAALAGAIEFGAGGGGAAARARDRALQFAAGNLDAMTNAAARTAAVDPTAKTVTVTLTMPGKRSLSALVMKSDPTIDVVSTAEIAGQVIACIYALNATAARAIDGNGSATLVGNNCAIQVNSSAADAMTNSGTITAKSICVVGGYSGSGYTPAPMTSCPATPDPFASIVIPAAGGCTQTNLTINSNTTLYPGVYCGGLSISGGATVSLQPGEYHFVDGPLKVTSSASLLGNEVAMILHGTASIDIAGSGEVVTTPPASGGLKGMSVVQNRSAPLGGVSKITGEGRFEFPGAIYLPRQALDVAGRASGNTFTPTYAAIVADTIKISGQGDLAATADTSLLPKSAAMSMTTAGARLIE